LGDRRCHQRRERENVAVARWDSLRLCSVTQTQQYSSNLRFGKADQPDRRGGGGKRAGRKQVRLKQTSAATAARAEASGKRPAGNGDAAARSEAAAAARFTAAAASSAAAAAAESSAAAAAAAHSAAAAAGAGAAADRSPEVEEVLKHRIRQIAYQVELLQNDALRIFLGSKDNARWWAFP